MLIAGMSKVEAFACSTGRLEVRYDERDVSVVAIGSTGAVDARQFQDLVCVEKGV